MSRIKKSYAEKKFKRVYNLYNRLNTQISELENILADTVSFEFSIVIDPINGLLLLNEDDGNLAPISRVLHFDAIHNSYDRELHERLSI